jgi:Kef-type K+ transport system membrane component KefB
MIHFLLALVLIVVFSKVFSEIFERIGLISLLGEFAAGLVLGVSFLNIIQGDDGVRQFAFVGVILLMFLAGYEETDMKFMLRTKRKLSAIALISLIGTIIALSFFAKFYFGFTIAQAILFAFIFGLTDVAVGAKALLSTGKLNTKTGESLLGIAVIDTVAGLILLAFAITVFTASNAVEVLVTFGGILLFFIITIVTAKYLPKLIHKTIRMRTEMMDVSVAFIAIFLLAYLAEELRLAAVLGAYFAGLILQKAPDLETDQFSNTVKSISFGFFIPIFFAWIALEADIMHIHTFLQEASIICLVVMGIKFGFILITTLLQRKSTFKEGIIYGVGMLAKGADNLIVLAIAINISIFTPMHKDMLLASLILTMILSVIISSILLKKLLRSQGLSEIE